MCFYSSGVLQALQPKADSADYALDVKQQVSSRAQNTPGVLMQGTWPKVVLECWKGVAGLSTSQLTRSELVMAQRGSWQHCWKHCRAEMGQHWLMYHGEWRQVHWPLNWDKGTRLVTWHIYIRDLPFISTQGSWLCSLWCLCIQCHEWSGLRMHGMSGMPSCILNTSMNMGVPVVCGADHTVGK